MFLAAGELLVFRLHVLRNELAYLTKIFRFIDQNKVAKTEEQKAWRDMFGTWETFDNLEEQRNILKLVIRNLAKEIAFSQKNKTI